MSLTLVSPAGESARRPYRPPAPIPMRSGSDPSACCGSCAPIRPRPGASGISRSFASRPARCWAIRSSFRPGCDPACAGRECGQLSEGRPAAPHPEAGLGEGLLTGGRETWRRVRRTLAPLFTPADGRWLRRTMLARAEKAAARIAETPAGGEVDVAAEMTGSPSTSSPAPSSRTASSAATPIASPRR